jgi:hypothetical protein
MNREYLSKLFLRTDEQKPKKRNDQNVLSGFDQTEQTEKMEVRVR